MTTPFDDGIEYAPSDRDPDALSQDEQDDDLDPDDLQELEGQDPADRV